ncbi:NINE protein [Candidatus Hodarchaeum mangrovi]
MAESSDINVYYYGLCEATHPVLKKGITCPNCGRKYCLDSINASIDAGLDQCSFCKTSFSYFPDINLDSSTARFCPTCGRKNIHKGKFCSNCGNSLTQENVSPPSYSPTPSTQTSPSREIRPLYRTPTPYQTIYPISEKNRLVALLLCFFLGFFGVHRFYLGKVFQD